MTQNELLDAYKSSQNYIQDKQIRLDLDIPSSKMSEIRKGNRYLTESQVIFLAEIAKVDPQEALIGLAADRSKSFKAKQIWEELAKKFESQRLQTLSVLVGAFSSASLLLNTSTTECVLCILC